MNNNPELRFAKTNDLIIVSNLLRLLAEDLANDSVHFNKGALSSVFESLVSQKRGCIIIAQDLDGPLGMVTVSFNLSLRHAGEYAQVEELIVSRTVRGKSIGSKLIKSAIDAARTRGCAEIGLYAVERNQPFYEKMGFSYAGPEMRLDLS